MRHVVIAATALGLLLAAPAAAQEHVPGPPLREVAVDDAGGVALAGTGQDVVLARFVPGAGWETEVLDGAGREPQVASGDDRTDVFAWQDVGRRTVALAVWRPGRAPVVRRFRGVSPRLVPLAGGGAVLAFRDGRALRIARTTGGTEVVTRSAARFALAAAGDGAVLAWVAPLRRLGAPRALHMQRLGPSGVSAGRPSLVSHDAGREVRLAGAPDGSAIAAWLRPGRSGRPAAAFTRRLPPVARPARPVPTPGGRAVAVPSVALGADGVAALAVLAFDGADPGFRVVQARSRAGGVWTGARVGPAPSAPVTSAVRAVLPGHAVWAAPRRQTGEPVFEVLAAARGEAPRVLGRHGTADGRSVGVEQRPGPPDFVAWPHEAGGFALTALAG